MPRINRVSSNQCRNAAAGSKLTKFSKTDIDHALATLTIDLKHVTVISYAIIVSKERGTESKTYTCEQELRSMSKEEDSLRFSGIDAMQQLQIHSNGMSDYEWAAKEGTYQSEASNIKWKEIVFWETIFFTIAVIPDMFMNLRRGWTRWKHYWKNIRVLLLLPLHLHPLLLRILQISKDKLSLTQCKKRCEGWILAFRSNLMH